MNQDIQIHRILGIKHFNTPEDQEHIAKHMNRAASGAYPLAVRELMKQYAWRIIRSETASDQEKEDAKLLICYSRWSRALEGGIPKEYFEEFMNDQLDHLDGKPIPDSARDKWEKYGG